MALSIFDVGVHDEQIVADTDPVCAVFRGDNGWWYWRWWGETTVSNQYDNRSDAEADARRAAED